MQESRQAGQHRTLSRQAAGEDACGLGGERAGEQVTGEHCLRGWQRSVAAEEGEASGRNGG